MSNSHIIKNLSESVREQVNNFVKPGRRLEMIQRLKIMQEQNYIKTESSNIFDNQDTYNNNRLNTITLNNNFRNRIIKSSLQRKKTISKTKTKTKNNELLCRIIFQF